MIRRATEDDVSAICGLVHELAEYEKASSLCTVRDDHLRSALFGENPSVFAHVAEHDGVVVGCALWFLNFSTWDGVNGIYLEDLYVQPDARGLLWQAYMLEMWAGWRAQPNPPGWPSKAEAREREKFYGRHKNRVD